MMVRIKWIAVIYLFLILPIAGQAQTDSLRTRQLGEVTIEGVKLFTLERLPPIQGTYIWAGKKTEVINVQALDANITDITPRQQGFFPDCCCGSM